MVHVAATWALVGLIWTVQVAVYPQFAVVKPEGFGRWHAGYTRSIGLVVVPLMMVEMVTGLIWVWIEADSALAWAGLGLMAINWACTALVQVPQHRRLGGGFDAQLVVELVRGNWIRTVVWSLRGLLVVAGGAQHFS